MVLRSFLLISLIFLSFDHPKLVKTKVADGITVSIPEGWRPMDGLDFTQRYPSVRAPLAAFTNEQRVADFSVNISATQWPDADINIAKQFFKSSVMNMFDRVEMIHEGTIELHGKQFVFFEFESRVNGNQTELGLNDPVTRYTYLQYLVEPKRTLVFSFNCPKREREQWQSTAAAIMKSIRVK
jgi:hypothetical protein